MHYGITHLIGNQTQKLSKDAFDVIGGHRGNVKSWLSLGIKLVTYGLSCRNKLCEPRNLTRPTCSNLLFIRR